MVCISVQEAARRLAVTHTSVHNWVAKGKLRGKKLPPLGFWAVDARAVKAAKRAMKKAARKAAARPNAAVPSKARAA